MKTIVLFVVFLTLLFFILFMYCALVLASRCDNNFEYLNNKNV